MVVISSFCVCAQMNIKNEKSHKIEHREVYMLHRLDIQRLSGKKTGKAKVYVR